MAYTQAEIYNLALGALLLTKKIADVETDTSSENSVLNVHWKIALGSALADMDLDGTSTQAALELLIENPTNLWQFAFKYPSNCALLRRIQTSTLKDTRSSQISKRVANHGGQKAIYTNEVAPIAEFISNNFPLAILSDPAALAIAYRLAFLSAPLVTGKGATTLREELMKKYLMAKSEAQELDRQENSNFDEDDVISEFVEARTS